MAIYNYNTLTGLIVPDTSTILADVKTEFQNAFGSDLDVNDLQTPQGVLISDETEARSTVINNNVQVANQINPNLAGGVFLDAICALTGLQRSAQTFSYGLCNLTGVAGTVIPAGVTAKDSNGNVYASNSTVTLNGSGMYSVTFTAVLPGPIATPASTLTTIVQGVLGWETITNPDDAILGTYTQSDQSLRALRRNTLALQGTGLSLAITSRLFTTPGVTSLSFLENVSSSTVVIEGVTMNPHSMYACVAGGTDLAVATTIAEVKDGGCDYTNGAGIPVNQNVTDPITGQVYTVLFDRPNLKPVLAKVYVSLANSVTDPTAAVQAAVLAYANGLLGANSGFVVGAPVSSFEIGGAVMAQVPGIFVHKVETKLVSGGSFSTDEIPIAVFEQATITGSSITVIIT